MVLAHAVRLQAMRAPDALHRANTDCAGLSHGGGRPMGRLAERIALRQRDDPFGDLMPERWNARGARFVPEQPVDAGRHVPLLPAPDGHLALPGPPPDLDRAAARGGQQHDPRPPDVLLWAVPIRYDRFQTDAVGGACIDANSLTHPRGSHAFRRIENSPFGSFRQARDVGMQA
jgi:hypothetical protein